MIECVLSNVPQWRRQSGQHNPHPLMEFSSRIRVTETGNASNAQRLCNPHRKLVRRFSTFRPMCRKVHGDCCLHTTTLVVQCVLYGCNGYDAFEEGLVAMCLDPRGCGCTRYTRAQHETQFVAIVIHVWVQTFNERSFCTVEFKPQELQRRSQRL